MKSKKPQMAREVPTWLSIMRQVAGRNATKYSAGGREKRRTRPVPSLPKLKCLESADRREEVPIARRLQREPD